MLILPVLYKARLLISRLGKITKNVEDLALWRSLNEKGMRNDILLFGFVLLDIYDTSLCCVLVMTVDWIRDIS